MTPETVITVGQQAMEVAAMLAAPLLLSSLAIGLLIGVFQAATQINEMTLSFIPKLMVIMFVLMTAGNWMLATMMDFTRRLYESIPFLIG
ncbi:MAG: flagellar biosynthesis protein FliQ [Gammaproteobacteria bacterium]|jgi:flagellar biosynthetic protein FliQ|nr:flagellar biosynthesis protein FliQ [Gammaproteobacteria bacterium]MBT3489886.1 flagellar biosynthesis protein FliQ [Gammaproteobacteria bacterium]MBT3719255.1 flagellar biosynthesis protein FliQ [Gammaproteobacteria bacterium]MBT3846049.1 flagellar biosynthesis protein FliQ [Gammaproteobacteria bacterium]MBT3893531.1 flagellar biosynthesis protein FliQ [Gammaproteobacteria bacterium]